MIDGNKKFLGRILVLCAVVALAAASVSGQNLFDDAVKQLTTDNVRGYLQPFVNGFGANVNSGLYHSAAIGAAGLSMRLEIVGMGTLIGDAEKSYTVTPPQPFEPTPVQTATVFGRQGTVVSGPAGIKYQFQNGQIETSVLPLAVPQLTVGNVLGTQAVVRYISIPEINDLPQVTFWGIGARHSISQYFPDLPVDLAASSFYQSLIIG